MQLRFVVGSVLCLALTACGAISSHSMPRTGVEIAAADLGAPPAAGRPIAFWADPGAEPRRKEFKAGMATVFFYPGQWATHLAQQLNGALKAKGAYDTRFDAFAEKAFRRVPVTEATAEEQPFFEVGLKEKSYSVYPPSNAKAVPADKGGATVATLTVKDVTAAGKMGGMDATIKVHLSMPGLEKDYDANVSANAWDKELMVELGKKILSDAALYAAPAAASGS